MAILAVRVAFFGTALLLNVFLLALELVFTFVLDDFDTDLVLVLF